MEICQISRDGWSRLLRTSVCVRSVKLPCLSVLPGATPFFSCSEFVVGIMSDWFVEAANHSCGSFPPEVDEMAAAGLTPVPSVRVAPPRVQESAVSMECKVRTVLTAVMLVRHNVERHQGSKVSGDCIY